tara:strand:+ start:107 stop:478 length:372 start_codon:yes stop_codon:yes gene_type:complete
MSDEIKFPNYKSAFYFGMIFCVFFALGMKSFFADSSSPLFNFIKSAENIKDPTKGRSLGWDGEYDYSGESHTQHRSRKYVFMPFCMIMSAIGMFGVCFSLSPTETLTKFRHMFKEVFRNFKPK